MVARVKPPENISPLEFFTAWIPRTVEQDPERRSRLGDTAASLVFVLTGEGEDTKEFTLHISEGLVRGEPGRGTQSDLEVRVDVETWRALNRGELSAPEALLKKRLQLTGDFVLALKLHLLLG